MKKVLALALLLLLFCTPALATNTIVVIDYEGAWVPVESHGFQLYLPIDWVLFEPEGDEIFSAGTADVSSYMAVEVYRNTGYTLQSIETELSAAKGYRNVRSRVFNGVPCVLYEFPGEDMFGAVAMSDDALNAYFFKFSPYGNDAFTHLADQIMSSLYPLEP